MRAIAIDAMGGDRAPDVIIEGALEASQEIEAKIILVGLKEKIESQLRARKYSSSKIEVFHAPEVVGMEESPAVALRKKKDASILVAARLVKEGQAEALVSAGSTGACVVATKTVLGTLEGVQRPAIATMIPYAGGLNLLLDVGANVDVKPRHLLQFAMMGSIFAQKVLHIPRPKVGLLNIGQEPSKGNEQTREAFELLQASNGFLEFIGNVEGNDIGTPKVDVIVCDGFVGNIVLKVVEGLIKTFFLGLREEVKKDWKSGLGAFLSSSAIKRLVKTYDYAEYGGALLLGIKGITLICHGGSNPRAIKNAIKYAQKAMDSQICHYITEGLKREV